MADNSRRIKQRARALAAKHGISYQQALEQLKGEYALLLSNEDSQHSTDVCMVFGALHRPVVAALNERDYAAVSQLLKTPHRIVEEAVAKRDPKFTALVRKELGYLDSAVLAYCQRHLSMFATWDKLLEDSLLTGPIRAISVDDELLRLNALEGNNALAKLDLLFEKALDVGWDNVYFYEFDRSFGLCEPHVPRAITEQWFKDDRDLAEFLTTIIQQFAPQVVAEHVVELEFMLYGRWVRMNIQLPPLDVSRPGFHMVIGPAVLAETYWKHCTHIAQTKPGLTVLQGQQASGRSTIAKLAALDFAADNKKVLYCPLDNTQDSLGEFIKKLGPNVKQSIQQRWDPKGITGLRELPLKTTTFSPQSVKELDEFLTHFAEQDLRFDVVVIDSINYLDLDDLPCLGETLVSAGLRQLSELQKKHRTSVVVTAGAGVGPARMVKRYGYVDYIFECERMETGRFDTQCILNTLDTGFAAVKENVVTAPGQYKLMLATDRQPRQQYSVDGDGVIDIPDRSGPLGTLSKKML